MVFASADEGYCDSVNLGTLRLSGQLLTRLGGHEQFRSRRWWKRCITSAATDGRGQRSVGDRQVAELWLCSGVWPGDFHCRDCSDREWFGVGIQQHVQRLPGRWVLQCPGSGSGRRVDGSHCWFSRSRRCRTTSEEEREEQQQVASCSSNTSRIRRCLGL